MWKLLIVTIVILILIALIICKFKANADYSGVWCLCEEDKPYFGLEQASLYMKKNKDNYDGYLVMSNLKQTIYDDILLFQKDVQQNDFNLSQFGVKLFPEQITLAHEDGMLSLIGPEQTHILRFKPAILDNLQVDQQQQIPHY